MSSHAYEKLFHRSLFDLPSSLFVAGTDMCIKRNDESFIACFCNHPPLLNTKAQKCPHCGNAILLVENSICLMAPLKEIEENCFLQIIYFFNFHTQHSKNVLLLEQVGEIMFDVWGHHVTYREFGATHEKQTLEFDITNHMFYQQSNTFKSLKKGFMPLNDEDFGQQWNFQRRRINRQIYKNYPVQVQLSIEYILIHHQKRLFSTTHNNISILLIYYAHVFYRKHPYMHSLPVPLMHMSDLKFYEKFQRFSSIEDFIEEGIFLNNAGKSIKRWFFEMLECCASKQELFQIDMTLILVALFSNPNYLLKALKTSQQIEKSLYENIIIGAEFFGYLGSQKGEKWLINHMFDPAFYNDDFYDIATFYSIGKEELASFVLPKVKTTGDIVNAIALFYEAKEKMRMYPSKSPFVYSALAYKFEGDYEGFTFRLPHSPQELFEWSQTQKNCLDEYCDKIIQQNIIILGAFKDKKHLFTIQLSSIGEFICAKGKNNQNIPGTWLEIALIYCQK